ncbi:hypothetical protein D9615_008458 [Tricholomella constricta]|uniref:Uncharacterized protein n=1 Tax=Tricholomella constricta TaxID=117010 RepID=A0A8H5H471_9AGAR|nr:hypothetical protein D9615_008458 [Tricholomella constricta]
MLPGERAILQNVGITILRYFAALAPVVLLHGVFIILIPFSTFTLLRRGLASRPTQAMLGMTLMAFLFSSLFCISTVSNIVICIREIELHFTGTLEDLERMDKSVSMTSSIQDVTMMLLPILSDSVVLWRAWVLYLDKQWVMLVPCAFLFGTIGTTFAFLVFDVKYYRTSMLDPIARELVKAFTTLSLGTNVAATSLIFYKLWAHLRFLRRMGIKQNSTSPVQKILIVLVESGLAYCALQLSMILVQFVPAPPVLSVKIARAILLNFLMALTAIYPSIIILVVSLQHSTAESFIFSTQVRNRSVQDIELSSACPASPGRLSVAVNSFDGETHVSSAAACVSKVANADRGLAGKVSATSALDGHIRANDYT